MDKEKPLKVHGTFDELLRVSMRPGKPLKPRPKRKPKPKAKK